MKTTIYCALFCLTIAICMLKCMETPFYTHKPQEEYKLVRITRDYAIFKISNALYINGTLPTLITFNSKQKFPIPTLRKMANSNPNNTMLNSEYEKYLKQVEYHKKKGTLKEFHDYMSLLQQSRIFLLRLKMNTDEYAI